MNPEFETLVALGFILMGIPSAFFMGKRSIEQQIQKRIIPPKNEWVVRTGTRKRFAERNELGYLGLDSNNEVIIKIAKGNQSIIIDQVPSSAGDFDERVRNAALAAEERAATLNGIEQEYV